MGTIQMFSNLFNITTGVAPTTETLKKGQMAVGKVDGKNKIYFNNDGTSIIEIVTGEPDVVVVQTTGVSETDVMSQKAVTNALASTKTEAVTEAKEYADNKVTSVYRLKGSKDTFAELPADGNAVGDVWNIKTAGGSDAQSQPVNAGDNVVWTGTGWERLGVTVDMSGYYTKTETEGLIPTKTSELTNDSDFVSDPDYNQYNDTDKAKVAALTMSGEGVKVLTDNGEYVDLVLAVKEI